MPKKKIKNDIKQQPREPNKALDNLVLLRKQTHVVRNLQKKTWGYLRNAGNMLLLCC